MKKKKKTIEDQGEKQIKALEAHRKQLPEYNAFVKRNDNDTENKLLLKEKRNKLKWW